MFLIMNHSICIVGANRIIYNIFVARLQRVIYHLKDPLLLVARSFQQTAAGTAETPKTDQHNSTSVKFLLTKHRIFIARLVCLFLFRWFLSFSIQTNSFPIIMYASTTLLQYGLCSTQNFYINKCVVLILWICLI